METPAAEAVKGFSSWAKQAPREVIVIVVLVFLGAWMWFDDQADQRDQKIWMKRDDDRSRHVREFIEKIDARISADIAVDKERNRLLADWIGSNRDRDEQLKKVIHDARFFVRRLDRLEARIDIALGHAGPPIGNRTVSPLRPER